MSDGGLPPPDPKDRIAASGLRRALSRYQGRLTGAVIDVGSGTPRYHGLLGPTARWHTVDVHPSNDLDLRADAHHLPFVDESFDGALCTQVLEHLEEPAVALREVARVLRRGAHLLVSAPQAWDLHEEPRDFWRFTSYGLRLLLDRSGLTLEALEATTGSVATSAQVLARTIGRAGRFPWVLEGLARTATWADRRFPDPSHPLGYVAWARRR